MKSKFNNKELLEKMYKKYKNGRIIAEKLGIHKALLYRWLKNYGITKNNLKRRVVNEEYFKNIDTQDKAYYLGLFGADGCIYKGASNNSYVFQINLKRASKKELIKLQKNIDTDYEVIDYITPNGYKASKIKISNTIFCKHLMRHGITPRKSNTYTMPIISTDLQRHFVRGSFDGDGGIYRNPNRNNKTEITFAGTLDYLRQLQTILLNKNISSAIYPCTNSNVVFRLVISELKSMYYLYNFMYKKSDTYFDSKYKKYTEFITEYLSRHSEMNGQ